MTFKEFEDFTDTFLTESQILIETKGKEYCHDTNNRFANFDWIAEKVGITRKQVAMVFFLKHVDAISYWIKNQRVESNESIMSRFQDSGNYNLLLAAIADEETSQNQL